MLPSHTPTRRLSGAYIVLCVVLVAAVLTLWAAVRTLSGSAAGEASGHTGHSDHAGHSGDTNKDHAMDMTMAFEASCSTVLWLSVLRTSSCSSYAVTCLLLAALTVVHEALAAYRVASSTRAPVPGAQDLLSTVRIMLHLEPRAWAAVLYAANICTGYLVMLAVMTYNVGYFLVVITAMGAGHYAFSGGGSMSSAPRADVCCGAAGDGLAA
jgi:Ctr copper transporter family